ncbi:putative membrane protein [Bacteroides fragilis str. S13 L11]|nr:putative membrane protein [Bacteroides fragilis str. S13 L11]
MKSSFVFDFYRFNLLIINALCDNFITYFFSIFAYRPDRT